MPSILHRLSIRTWSPWPCYSSSRFYQFKCTAEDYCWVSSALQKHKGGHRSTPSLLTHMHASALAALHHYLACVRQGCTAARQAGAAMRHRKRVMRGSNEASPCAAQCIMCSRSRLFGLLAALRGIADEWAVSRKPVRLGLRGNISVRGMIHEGHTPSCSPFNPKHYRCNEPALSPELDQLI